MSEKEKYQKIIKKALWIWLLTVLVCLVPIILGIFYLDQENYPVGAPLLCVGLAIFIAGMIYVLVVSLKTNKKIFSLNENEILNTMDQQEGKEEFLSTDNRKIVFGESGFWCDDVWHGFEEYQYFAAMSLDGKWTSTYSLVVLMIHETDEMISLPLDQDVMGILEKQNVQLENQEDLDYFKENPTLSFKKIRNSFAFQPKPFCILQFAKNEEEKKASNRGRLLGMIIFLIFFAVTIGFVALITWLSDTKSGLAVSNQIGFHWWIKALFSIGLLLGAILLKKEKWYVRVAVVLYLVGYWITLFISYRSSILWDCISILVFTGFSIAYIFTKKEEKNKVGLAPILAILLGLFLIMGYEDYVFINENVIWILFGVFSGVGVLICIGFSIGYMKLKKPDLKKQIVALYTFCSLVFIAMFGFFMSMGFVSSLNFALDFSTPIQEEYKIEELKPSDEYSSAKAVVVVGGKKIEVAITNDEYYSFEVGDKITIEKHQGAFHIEYYYHS